MCKCLQNNEATPPFYQASKIERITVFCLSKQIKSQQSRPHYYISFFKYAKQNKIKMSLFLCVCLFTDPSIQQNCLLLWKQSQSWELTSQEAQNWSSYRWDQTLTSMGNLCTVTAKGLDVFSCMAPLLDTVIGRWIEALRSRMVEFRYYSSPLGQQEDLAIQTH